MLFFDGDRYSHEDHMYYLSPFIGDEVRFEILTPTFHYDDEELLLAETVNARFNFNEEKILVPSDTYTLISELLLSTTACINNEEGVTCDFFNT